MRNGLSVAMRKSPPVVPEPTRPLIAHRLDSGDYVRAWPQVGRARCLLKPSRSPTWTSHWMYPSEVPHRADVRSAHRVGGMGCPVGCGLEPAQKGNPATPRASVNMGNTLVAGSERLGLVDGPGRGASNTAQTTLPPSAVGRDPERA